MTHPLPRACLRDPIREIAEAAMLLDEAVAAHLRADADRARMLIARADMPVIAQWVESILGKNSPYVRVVPTREPVVAPGLRIQARMPNAQEKRQLHARDGFHCRFCGIPVIRQEVREAIRRAYPDVLRWGKRNVDRHAAFFAMWVQYDHLVPHSRGGTNGLENLAVTCAACNYGRGGYTLGEVGLAHPLERPPVRSAWGGLESFRSNWPLAHAGCALPAIN